MKREKASSVALAAGIISFSSVHVSADTGAEFFKGKKVTVVVATAAGGGYDFYGRLVSEFMARELDGSSFIVRNMPGAAHMIGGNFVYASKPDGLTLGTLSMGLIYAQLLSLDGAKFDLARMSWVGKVASEGRSLVVSRQSGLESFEDVMKASRPLRFASSGVGGANYADTGMLIKVAGLNARAITGYNGGAGELAMRRGEVDGTVASYSTARAFANSGHGKVVVMFGNARDGVPGLTEFAKSPLAQRVSAMVGSMSDIIRVFGGPPEIPADRLTALRVAFNATMKNPEFVEKLKQSQNPLDPKTGDQVETLIKDALNQPPETIRLLKEVLEEGKKIKTPIFRGTISQLDDDSRVVTLKLEDGGNFIAKVSGSRTALKIAGSKVERRQLALGMVCAVTSPTSESEAELIDCR